MEMVHDQHILFSLGKSENIPREEAWWPEAETSKDTPQSRLCHSAKAPTNKTREGKPTESDKLCARSSTAHQIPPVPRNTIKTIRGQPEWCLLEKL